MGSGQGCDSRSDPPAVSTGQSRPPNGRTDGFALVVVIWAVGILTLLFMTYIVAARYRAIEAASLAQHARADAMATIGINLAIMDLLSGVATGRVSSRRFAPDGTPVACALGEGWGLSISVADEGGKVDLNSANIELIEALVRRMSAEAETATAIVRNIRSLRETAEVTRSNQAGSPPAAFRSLLELDQVAGMDRALYRRLVPLVTVHSGNPGLDPSVAPTQLLRTLSPGDIVFSREAARRDLPGIYIAQSAGTAFLVGSEAVGASGARFSRDAVVELSRDEPTGYRIREWREGGRRSADTDSVRLPPC